MKKNILAENMRRFGTKNLSEQLNNNLDLDLKNRGVDLKVKGIALKIAGTFLDLMFFHTWQEKDRVVNALKLIPQNGGQRVYDELIHILQTNQNIKTKFHQNYNLVSTLIKDTFEPITGRKKQNDLVSNALNSLTDLTDMERDIFLLEKEFINKCKAILTKYNPNETDFGPLWK